MSWIPSYKKPGGGGGMPEIVTWSDGTDEQLVAMVQAHYDGLLDLHDYWAIGDERIVSLSAMAGLDINPTTYAAQNVVYVLSEVGGKYLADNVTECAFQVDQKNSLNEYLRTNPNDNTDVGGWKECPSRTWLNTTYKNALPSTFTSIFKEFINQSGVGNKVDNVENTIDTFAFRAEIEVFGSRTYSVAGEGNQVKYYETSSNRIKQRAGSDNNWWERSPGSSTTSSSQNFCNVNQSGNKAITNARNASGCSPFGVI